MMMMMMMMMMGGTMLIYYYMLICILTYWVVPHQEGPYLDGLVVPPPLVLSPARACRPCSPP